MNSSVENVEKQEKTTGRKKFVVKTIDGVAKDKEKELAVFTHAKKLAGYIFVITEKSPKKLRWGIVSKLQNTSIDIIDNLYQANFEKGEKRLSFQVRAGGYLQLLDFYTETAKKMQAITNKQMIVIGKQLFEVKKLLGRGTKSVKNSI